MKVIVELKSFAMISIEKNQLVIKLVTLGTCALFLIKNEKI